MGSHSDGEQVDEGVDDIPAQTPRNGGSMSLVTEQPGPTPDDDLPGGGPATHPEYEEDPDVFIDEGDDSDDDEPMFVDDGDEPGDDLSPPPPPPPPADGVPSRPPPTPPPSGGVPSSGRWEPVRISSSSSNDQGGANTPLQEKSHDEWGSAAQGIAGSLECSTSPRQVITDVTISLSKREQ